MGTSMAVSIEKFNYRGDMLDVVTDEKGEHYVVLARLCDPFHLDVKTQAEKVNSFAWSTWGIFPMVAADGKTREQVCLSIRSVAGWLFTINAGKIAPHLREKLARYQRECADVLADHFLGKRGLSPQGITIEVLAAALAPFTKGFEALSLGFAAMNDRLTALEQRSRDGEIMSRERSNALKARVRSCALDLSKYGNEKRRAASLRMHKRLKMKVGWFGDHCRLDNMPARYEADVLREMEIIEHETRGSVTASRQMSFPPLRAVNVNGKRTSA